MRRSILLLVLVLLAPTAGASPGDAFRDAVATLQKAAQQPTTVPQKEAMCRDVVDKAAANLDTLRIRYTKASDGFSLAIHTGFNTPLNAYAEKIARLSRAVAVYKPMHFFDQPYSAAAFDRKRNLIVLPHDAILLGRSDVPSLRHETIHLVVWAQLLKRAPSPYHGTLLGAAFQPSSLNLDEMRAYASDLKILGTRLAITPTETLYEALTKKLEHAENHTLPVGAVIEAALKSPDVRYAHSAPEGVIAEVRGEAGPPFLAVIPLLASQSVTDPGNTNLLHAQLLSTQARTLQHVEALVNVRTAVTNVDAAAPGDRLAALRELGRICAQLPWSPDVL